MYWKSRCLMTLFQWQYLLLTDRVWIVWYDIHQASESDESFCVKVLRSSFPILAISNLFELTPVASWTDVWHKWVIRHTLDERLTQGFVLCYERLTQGMVLCCDRLTQDLVLCCERLTQGFVLHFWEVNIGYGVMLWEVKTGSCVMLLEVNTLSCIMLLEVNTASCVM